MRTISSDPCTPTAMLPFTRRASPPNIDPALSEAALQQLGVRAFDITGRPMKGWLLVSPEATARPAALAEWVERGVAYARTLPAK